MEKSFSLIRTNVRLTSNVKIVVGPTYSLFLDSIDSHPELNKSRYRKFRLTPAEDLSYRYSAYYLNTTSEISFAIKDDLDADNMTLDFSRQIDSLYHSGPKNISQDKNYTEEFEYFAPLHVTKNKLPTHFIIFRVDGPGLINLNRENFINEIVNKLKVIKVFDMTSESALGQFLNKNIDRNDAFPNNCMSVFFARNENCFFTGNDLSSGGITTKSKSLENFFFIQNPFSETDKYFTDIWSTEKISYPFILNMSFLFDDEPATDTSLRKWSLNRYYGFYFDNLEFYQEISPSALPEVEDDAFIDVNNILKTRSGNQPFSDPDNLTNYPYIEIEGVRYKVLECPCAGPEMGTGSKCWKIISDKDLSGKPLKPPGIKPGVVEIVSENGINTIKYTDGTLFDISGFEDYHMWLIKIGENYHKLIKDGVTGEIRVFSDYAFEKKTGQIDYYVNDPDPKYRFSLKFTTDNPIKYKIYRCKFTEIKDFDTDLIETKFARFEYEKRSQISRTQESKFFFTNLNSNSVPQSVHDFSLGNQVVYLPCSSHYTANNELFRLLTNSNNMILNPQSLPPLRLNDLWKKNPKILKWGYQNSLSTGDTQYLLNNSTSADDFNRTTNTLIYEPNRIEKNLDYFYTINSDSDDYVFHSLHVEMKTSFGLHKDFKFEMDKYLGISYSYDYFSYFFGKTNVIDFDKFINQKKWSYVNPSGLPFPRQTNNTLFKGLKFNISKVNSLKITNKIDQINVGYTNDFAHYKFSILFSENEYDFEPYQNDLNSLNAFPIKNVLNYEIYDLWQGGRYYATNSVVLWKDMLFTTFTGSNIPVSKKSPIGTNFQPIPERNIFWSPIYDGTSLSTSNVQDVLTTRAMPVVYNSGEYWYFGPRSPNFSGEFENGAGVVPFSPVFHFWSPYRSYNAVNSNPDIRRFLLEGKIAVAGISAVLNSNNTALFQGKYYVCFVSTNDIPGESTKWREFEHFNKYYGSKNDLLLWRKVSLWVRSVNSVVRRGQYVLRPGTDGYYTLYYCKSSNPSVFDPDISPTYFRRVHSFGFKSTIQYGPSFSSNDLIRLHDSQRIYKRLESSTDPAPEGGRKNERINDGVNIFINKKWKNILINIYSNDGTLKKYLKNVNRDNLYNDLFKKFVARNFIDYFNNLELLYSFSNLIRYIIIEPDGKRKIYDFNNLQSAKNLPYIIKIETPQDFTIFSKTLSVAKVPISENILKATKRLTEGRIFTLDQINWYSDVPYSNLLQKPTFNFNPYTNYNSQILSDITTFYRFSGSYAPIFNEIQVFNSIYGTYSLDTGIGDLKPENVKFQTELENFGLTREIIISKANRSANILKLSNSTTQKSIFPMLDEYGYQVTKSFIFKSNWDFGYLQECFIPNNENTSSSSLNLTLGSPGDQL